MIDLVKSGRPAPTSGQYVDVGPRGGVKSDNEITAVRGKPMPPSSNPGNGSKLVDPTKHQK